MSERFDGGDYSEYLAYLENSLDKDTSKDNSAAPYRREVLQSSIRQPAKKRKRRLSVKAFMLLVVCVFLTLGIVALVVNIPKSEQIKDSDANTSSVLYDGENEDALPEKTQKKTESPIPDFIYGAGGEFTEKTLNSESYIFVKLSDNTVKTHLNAKKRMYPASTTKLMTLLVAVDNITDFEDTFTFSSDITYPLYRANATVAGFVPDEAVSMTDMLYGLILPSGGDAAIGLARKIAGSEEEFVALMNQTAKDLGLSDTHFTNCTGLFNDNHYSTAEDMAKITAAVIKNPLCREIISTYKYKTKPTDKHPEGIELTSTLFSYMYGTEPEGSDILGGKTGFVNESGYCIASYGRCETSDEEYVCVTFKARSKYPAVYDQIDLFTAFGKN